MRFIPPLTNQQVVKDNLLSYYHRKLITFNGLTRPCLLSMGLGGSRSYRWSEPQFSQGKLSPTITIENQCHLLTMKGFQCFYCSHLLTTKSFGNARSDYLDEVYCSTNLLTVSSILMFCFMTDDTKCNSVIYIKS